MEWNKRLLAVASGQNLQDAVTFHTNASIYRCDLDQGRKITFEDTQNRRVFIYLTEGYLSVNGQEIRGGGQARIDIEELLVLQANQNAAFILIDVSSCKGWGYNDITLRGAKMKG